MKRHFGPRVPYDICTESVISRKITETAAPNSESALPKHLFQSIQTMTQTCAQLDLHTESMTIFSQQCHFATKSQLEMPATHARAIKPTVQILQCESLQTPTHVFNEPRTHWHTQRIIYYTHPSQTPPGLTLHPCNSYVISKRAMNEHGLSRTFASLCDASANTSES